MTVQDEGVIGNEGDSTSIPSSSSGKSHHGSAGLSPLRAGFSGAIAGIGTEVIFYGLDSYKVMKQAGEPLQMSRLFRGALPIAMLGSGPSFGVFFFGYGYLRDHSQQLLAPYNVPASIPVLVASLISAVPSSLVAVPADVLKKRLILTTEGNKSLFATAKSIVAKDGIAGLFVGWNANLLKDIPFAAIKMSLYEGIARMYLDMVYVQTSKRPEWKDQALNSDMLSQQDAAVVGFLSGAVTAVLTNPLDCVNTRMKSGELSQMSLLQAHKHIVKQDGVKALFRGIIPRITIIGLGSTVFWWLYAVANDH